MRAGTELRRKDQALYPPARHHESGELRKFVALGIVRDADEDAGAALNSVQEALRSLDLPAPDQPGEVALGHPRVRVLILLPGEQIGMLESVCLQTVSEDPAMPCVEQFMACIESSDASGPKNEIKARALAFLASRAKTTDETGIAARQGAWDLDHPAFTPLKDFLRSLCS